MEHIRVPRYLDELRQPLGWGAKPPERDQQAHGGELSSQLSQAVDSTAQYRRQRDPDLPELPPDIQTLLKGTTTTTGKALLERDDVPKSWQLEVIDERRDGLLVTLSPDPGLSKLRQRVEWYRNDERTETGRRKGGVKALFSLDGIAASSRTDRLGDELALIQIQPDKRYLVDIEVAAGYEQDDGEARRRGFAAYLRNGGADIVGSGPVVEVDYCLFRAWVSGRLLNDILDTHPWVIFVDSPPEIERQGMQLLNISLPDLPEFEEPEEDSPVVGLLDGGIIPQQPLIARSLAGQTHTSYLPGNSTTTDGGSEGHGTAVASIIALGSLREALLNHTGSVRPVRVALARLLDDDTRLPQEVNLKSVLPRIARKARELHQIQILNHSIASRAPFRKSRMSVWAETLDRLVYDDGADGFLVVVAAGNIDGHITPTLDQIQNWLNSPGYPAYLSDENCRLRNPAHAINVLTVGSYVPTAGTPFYAKQIHGAHPVAGSNYPSPFTRTGFGYLGEVKPEVVEEGGNWYIDSSGSLTTGSSLITDVPVANASFATDGNLVKFTHGTSFAAPKVSHLAACILEAIPDAGVDLLRALIVNCAEWPEQVGTVQDTLRWIGYGVPIAERAILPATSRCLIIIEDTIEIGHAQYFRVPFPRDLFEANPETILQVSVTLAYRAPVRKTNLKYRGTILQWDLAKRGESLDNFRKRFSRITEAPDNDNQATGDEPIGGWNWVVKIRQRTRGTAQKDWFRAPAQDFDDDLYLGVIGRRGWLSKQQQDDGWPQRYAVAVCIEVEGVAIPIHEEIEVRVRNLIPVQVPAT